MKKNIIWLLAAILSCGLMLTACSSNDDFTEPVKPDDEVKMPEVSRDFDKVADWMAAAVQKCHPNIRKAWNNDADPADFNLLLANSEKTRIYLINPNTKKEVPQAEWTDVLKQSLDEITSFAHLPFDGKNCTIILVDFNEFDALKEIKSQYAGREVTDEDYMFDLLALFYHESFHAYVQTSLKDWQNGEGEYNRSQSYPIDYNPRIYRKLALLALRNVWDDNSKKEAQYARAKYWTNKYEQAYATEAAGIKSTDIDEATADYFERNVLHPAFNRYPLINDINGFELGSMVSIESYLSSIAIQLAQREGRLNEAIEAFKSQTLTPINFLLQDVAVPAVYDESQDAADIERIRQATSKNIGDESPALQPVIQACEVHKAGEAIYLGVLFVSGSNSNSQGDFVLTDLPGYGCEAVYSVSTSNYDILEKTIMTHSEYLLVPIENADALTLEGLHDVQDVSSSIGAVAITQEAQVTAVNGVDGFTMKTLPFKVYIGKDSYGNSYYLCSEKK